MKKRNIIPEAKLRTLKAGGISFHLHCYKCGHDWEDEKHEKPKICPNCHSLNYNKQSSARRTTKSSTKVLRKRKIAVPTPKPELELIPEPKEKRTEGVKVKRTFTPRFYMMILSGVVSAIGISLFVLYFFSLNTFLGLSGITLVVAGIFAFRYYWSKEGNVAIEHIEGIETEEDSTNCLNIYPNRVVFETMLKPEGFPMLCLNLNKKYYVHIMDPETKRLVPFALPDQQYFDPIVFAQRVLGLPAHRKIFERKPKLLQKLKTAMLVLAIGIVWLLIMTTTGEG